MVSQLNLFGSFVTVRTKCHKPSQIIELVQVVVTFIGLTIVSNKFVTVSQRSQLARSIYFPSAKTRIHSEEVNSYMPLLCGWDKALQYCNDSDDQAALQNHFHVYPFVMRNWAMRIVYMHSLAVGFWQVMKAIIFPTVLVNPGSYLIAGILQSSFL